MTFNLLARLYDSNKIENSKKMSIDASLANFDIKTNLFFSAQQKGSEEYE